MKVGKACVVSDSLGPVWFGAHSRACVIHVGWVALKKITQLTQCRKMLTSLSYNDPRYSLEREINSQILKVVSQTIGVYLEVIFKNGKIILMCGAYVIPIIYQTKAR